MPGNWAFQMWGRVGYYSPCI